MSKREARYLGRELTRLNNDGLIEAAEINKEAELQAERIRALGYVGKTAMHEVTLLSQLEQQLAALVPSAAGRLQGLDDLAALAMADVVTDTVRKVR
jgi:DNA-binding ferritin-like protein